MTAEQILEEIEYLLENLERFLHFMTKMRLDGKVEEKEFTALINNIHYQVLQISKAVNVK